MMSHDYPAPAIGDLPSGGTISTGYERVCQLAAAHLDGPVSVDIDAWEDGELRIRAFHVYSPGGPNSERLKAVVRYHSAEPTIRGALLAVDPDSAEETLLFQTDLADADGGGRTPEKKLGLAGGD
jgi:hypothetical protein